jgi:hypothetical protein
MFTVKKYFAAALAGAFIVSFGASALAHPGHIEQSKKSQKRAGKHAANNETKGVLALSSGRNAPVDLAVAS